MAPDIARIVDRRQINLPISERDETLVFHVVDELMQVPPVDAAFCVDEKSV